MTTTHVILWAMLVIGLIRLAQLLECIFSEITDRRREEDEVRLQEFQASIRGDRIAALEAEVFEPIEDMIARVEREVVSGLRSSPPAT